MIEKGSSRGEEDVVVEDVVDNIFEQWNTAACTMYLWQKKVISFDRWTKKMTIFLFVDL